MSVRTSSRCRCGAVIAPNDPTCPGCGVEISPSPALVEAPQRAAARPLYPPEYRYEHDVAFHHVVDMLESVIHSTQMTPMEVREASMLAAIHYELRNVRAFRRDLSTSGVTDKTYAETHERMDAARGRMEEIRQWMESLPLAAEGDRR